MLSSSQLHGEEDEYHREMRDSLGTTHNVESTSKQTAFELLSVSITIADGVFAAIVEQRGLR